MVMCLVAVKIVRVPDRNPGLRLPARESLPPADTEEVSDDNESDYDEVVYVQKGIALILLAGLLPIMVWLGFYLLCPEALNIDITP